MRKSKGPREVKWFPEAQPGAGSAGTPAQASVVCRQQRGGCLEEATNR